jgi:hypothetical protein
MSETPEPERPADDEPSGAAAEMQQEDGDTSEDTVEEDPAKPDEES